MKRLVWFAFALAAVGAWGCAPGSMAGDDDDDDIAGVDGGGTDGGPSDPTPDAMPLTDAPACATQRVEAEEATAPVDIIWVVDTSGSMDFEAATIESNLNDFAAQIDSWGIDYRVIMIADRGTSGNAICVPPPLGGPGCTDGPNFRHVNENVGSDEGLRDVMNTYSQYQDVLRANSIKHFVAVSDDEADSSYDDGWFRGQILTKTAPGFPTTPGVPQGYIFHSIVAFGDIPFIGCLTGAWYGQSYLDLTDLTLGVAAKVCETDWTPIFDALQTAVLENTDLPCTFDIPEPPEGETLDPDRVNVVFTPTGGTDVTIPRVDSEADCGGGQGWYYDNPGDPTQIIVCPATCTVFEGDVTGVVDLAFGCATIVL